MRAWLCVVFLGGLLQILACGSSDRGGAHAESKDVPTYQMTSPPPVRVTSRPANTNGAVFILMYHRIKESPDDYDRTPEDFRRDLRTLYDAGFRPVTLGEYVSGTFEISGGASPVVITFDDSDPTQFRLLEDGSVDPECAVGVMQAFAAAHEDFPMRATFFVLKSRLFGSRGKEKVAQLIGWGCEVGSHTVLHKRLDRMTDDEAKAELAEAQEALRDLGVTGPIALSLPFGIRPKNHDLLKSFEWSGTTYTHSAAVMVGAGPAPSPSNKERDLYALPRIHAYVGDRGLYYWINKVKAGEVSLYVQP